MNCPISLETNEEGDIMEYLEWVENDLAVYIYQSTRAARDVGVKGKCIAYAIKLAATGEWMVRRTMDPATERVVGTRGEAVEYLKELLGPFKSFVSELRG